MKEKDAKSLINKRQDVAHNEELGNNFYPSGWQPNVSFDESTKLGEITHVQAESNTFKYNTLLKDWGFNPDEFYIDQDTVKFSTWNAQKKRWKHC